MPKALDLNGQIFTNLKVIQKAPSRSGKTYWTCECMLCGSIKDYQTGHLTNGSSKSCGCQNGKNFNYSNTVLEKQCQICSQTFTTNARNRLYCYECSPEQSTPGSKDYQKSRKRAVKHQLILYKGGKCEKCGYDKCEGALQLHHRVPEEKSFTLSSINVSKELNMTKLYKEADKCALLCANCHAEEHYQE